MATPAKQVKAAVKAKRAADKNAPDEYRLIRRVLHKIERKTDAELKFFTADVLKQDELPKALVNAFSAFAEKEAESRAKK